MTDEHTLSAFDDDLLNLRDTVRRMGAMVERQFERAIDAVRYVDLRRVARVLSDERTVNAMQVEADLQCNLLIARRQPTAVDLREVIGVLHAISDLERIGDEAKKIALKADAFEAGRLPIDAALLVEFSDSVAAMLASARASFETRDTVLARSVMQMDEQVDSRRDALVAQLLVQMNEAGGAAAQLLAMVFVVQSIERVGDHAKNLAEYVINIVEGIDPRHGNAAKATLPA